MTRSIAAARWNVWRCILAAALFAAATAADARELHVSGSVFADFSHVSSDVARRSGNASFTPEAALKLDADLTEQLSFSGGACVGCHGVDVAHAQVDFSPSRRLSVTAGRIVVPFGDLSQRYDPAGHRTSSKPLIYDMGRMAYSTYFNSGVLPTPYSDTGALVSGQVFPLESLQVWYGAYGVGGLQGDPKKELVFRSTKKDDNASPAGGGRVATSWTANPGSWLREASLGGSFAAGRYGIEGTTRPYRLWGLDATVRVAEVTVRGEYAARRTDLLPGIAQGDRLDKSGLYAEVEHPVGRWVTAVYRFDQLRRDGPPTDSGIAARLDGRHLRVERYTAGVEIRPVDALFVKASVEHWRPNQLPTANGLHLGIGGTY